MEDLVFAKGRVTSNINFPVKIWTPSSSMSRTSEERLTGNATTQRSDSAAMRGNRAIASQ
jgi:hypothetical protein